MIRDAVIHLMADQPILADLFEMPTPDDNALICRNVRTLEGKVPAYIDSSESTFIFPYATIRFVELRRGAGHDAEGEAGVPAEPEELEIDEEFLRRVRDA